MTLVIIPSIAQIFQQNANSRTKRAFPRGIPAQTPICYGLVLLASQNGQPDQGRTSALTKKNRYAI
jgi:hypothetical protein